MEPCCCFYPNVMFTRIVRKAELLQVFIRKQLIVKWPTLVFQFAASFVYLPLCDVSDTPTVKGFEKCFDVFNEVYYLPWGNQRP